MDVGLIPTKELEKCRKCGGATFVLDKTYLSEKGYGIKCSKCNFLLRWTGKLNKPRRKANWYFKSVHTEEGKNFCEFCGISGEVAILKGITLELDHIVPLFAGGEDSLDNTRLLCSYCHKLKSSLELKVRLDELIG